MQAVGDEEGRRLVDSEAQGALSIDLERLLTGLEPGF